jgi:Mn-dependent DtxR family transcriptional regulator
MQIEKDTQLESWAQCQPHRRLQEIKKIIADNGPQTRRQLAKKLNVESNSVTAAVWLGLKLDLVELDEVVFDEETKRNQRLLDLTERNPSKIKAKISKTKQIAVLSKHLAEVTQQYHELLDFLFASSGGSNV